MHTISRWVLSASIAVSTLGMLVLSILLDPLRAVPQMLASRSLAYADDAGIEDTVPKLIYIVGGLIIAIGVIALVYTYVFQPATSTVKGALGQVNNATGNIP